MSYIFDISSMLQEIAADGYGLTTAGFTYTFQAQRRSGSINEWQAPCALYSGGENIAHYFNESASPRQLRSQWSNTGCQKRRELSGVADTTWYQFIVQVIDGADPRVWIDNVEITSSVPLNCATPPGVWDFAGFNTINIGGWWDAGTGPGAGFDGKVAEFGLWNRLLSAGEISNLGTGTLIPDVAADPAGLIRYWPMYDNLTDLSGSGANLTILHGTPTADPLDHPVAAPSDAPTYIGPDTIGDKIGDDIGSIDVRTWWDTPNTITDITFDQLPAGISYAGNTTYLLTSRPTAQAENGMVSTMTCTDDGAAGSVNAQIVWSVLPYQIVFSGNNKIENPDGTAYATATGVGYSVWPGQFADMTGDPLLEDTDLGVSNGELTITLLDSETEPLTYTVFIGDLDEADNVVPLTISERTSV